MGVNERVFQRDLQIGFVNKADVTVIGWTGRGFDSVAVHARAGGLHFDLDGSPAQARQLGEALIAASDAFTVPDAAEWERRTIDALDEYARTGAPVCLDQLRAGIVR